MAQMNSSINVTALGAVISRSLQFGPSLARRE